MFKLVAANQAAYDAAFAGQVLGQHIRRRATRMSSPTGCNVPFNNGKLLNSLMCEW